MKIHLIGKNTLMCSGCSVVTFEIFMTNFAFNENLLKFACRFSSHTPDV